MTTALPSVPIHVVLGVAMHEGRVLVARRDAQRHQGGCLEFPGGKLEPGESPEQALRREWLEEVGVAAELGAPIIRFTYDYDDRRLLIDVREVHVASDATAERGLAWRRVESLSPQEFPPANRTILNALKLPQTYVISSDATSLERRFEQLLADGARLILFRAKEIADEPYRRFAKHFISEARAADAQLLLHDRPEAAVALGAAGVHLSQAAFVKVHGKRPLPSEFWFAVSCHRLEEVRCAEAVGADFCTLGPVKPTPGHTTPLGLDAFAQIVSEARIPVYALGGLRTEDLSEARACGAQGIAGIRCFGL